MKPIILSLFFYLITFSNVSQMQARKYSSPNLPAINSDKIKTVMVDSLSFVSNFLAGLVGTFTQSGNETWLKNLRDAELSDLGEQCDIETLQAELFKVNSNLGTVKTAKGYPKVQGGRDCTGDNTLCLEVLKKELEKVENKLKISNLDKDTRKWKNKQKKILQNNIQKLNDNNFFPYSLFNKLSVSNVVSAIQNSMVYILQQIKAIIPIALKCIGKTTQSKIASVKNDLMILSNNLLQKKLFDKQNIEIAKKYIIKVITAYPSFYLNYFMTIYEIFHAKDKAKLGFSLGTLFGLTMKYNTGMVKKLK